MIGYKHIDRLSMKYKDGLEVPTRLKGSPKHFSNFQAKLILDLLCVTK